MPVNTYELNPLRVPTFSHIQGNDCHDHHSGKDMRSVQSGRGVVERPEDIPEHREALRDFRGIFIRFYKQEDKSPSDGVPQQPEGFSKFFLFCRRMGQHHAKAGCQQNKGVEGSSWNTGMFRLGSPGRIAQTVEQVDCYQTTKNYNFRSQHPPKG